MTPEEIVKHIKFPVKYDEGSQMILSATGQMICDIRGWGWIQYLPNAEQLQDNMGVLIANKINELNSASPAEFKEDIDTIGKCANCGVEFHIHKENKNQQP